MIFTVDVLTCPPTGGPMTPRTIRQADDYTDAFLVTLGVLLFISFWMIAAAYGYVWLAVTAYSIDHGIKWIGRRRTG